MNVEASIWDKLTRVAIFLIFVAFLLFIGLRYLPVVQQNERMRRRIGQLDAQLERAEDAKRQVNLAYDALRYDPKAVERLARERLGYAKTGETVVRFEAPSTNLTFRPPP